MDKNNKHLYLAPTAIALALSLSIGCSSESTESENVTTQGIWTKMEVRSDQEGSSRVTVELNVGGQFGTNVVLSSNEYLEVSANGQTVRMIEDEDFLDVDYQAYLDTSVSDTEFNVRFYRSNGESIVGSRGNLPASFSLTAPQSGTIYSRDEVADITWSPGLAGETIELRSSLSCTDTQGASFSSLDSIMVNDSGSYSYTISDHSLFDDQTRTIDTTKQCDITFALVREGDGVVDPAFTSGGIFLLQQIRETQGLKVNP